MHSSIYVIDFTLLRIGETRRYKELDADKRLQVVGERHPDNLRGARLRGLATPGTVSNRDLYLKPGYHLLL